MSIKDAIRAATLGGNITRKRVRITIPGGDVEVVQPSLAERAAIMKSGGVKGKSDDVVLMTRLAALAAIRLTVAAGTDERVWTDADMDSLLQQPPGEWFDRVQDAAGKLLGGKGGTEGNGDSETTPSDDSSFASPGT